MLERPNYDACDDRLKAKIDSVSKVMLSNIWVEVFKELDRTDMRLMVSGDDAGRLAQMCVEAIADELPECLAK
jgi:hypothetical protein